MAVLSWVKSYLTGRSQRVSLNGATFRKSSLSFGVPQASCSRPVLFVFYTSKLLVIIESHLPEVHCFADESQLHLSFKLGDAKTQDEAVAAMKNCIRDLRTWMLQDELKINDDKVEFIIIGSKKQLSKLNECSIRLGSTDVFPVKTVINLGSWFDSNLSMSTVIINDRPARLIALCYGYFCERCLIFCPNEHVIIINDRPARPTALWCGYCYERCLIFLP